MLSRNDHKQHDDTPVFTACDDGFGTSLFGTVRILFGFIWPCWRVSDLSVSDAVCMHAKEPVLL